MNTTIPGKIISYDGRTAVVEPAMPMQLANGDALKAPRIVSVPVYWLVGDDGKAQITVPLKRGDDCVLHFSQRSIENWLSGSDQAPDDPRQFDLTDCFATPVMRPTVTRADTENVNIQYGRGTMKIAPNGDLTIDVPNMTCNVGNKTLINTETMEVNATQTTYNSNVTVNGLFTYTQGMVGTGGTGATAEISGNVAFKNGSLTHNGTNVGDTHKHDGVQTGGGTTGSPV